MYERYSLFAGCTGLGKRCKVPAVSRRRRGAGLTAALAVVALTAVAGTAVAENFEGQTSDGRYVRIKTNEFDVPELLAIRFQAPCNSGNLRYVAKIINGGPYRSQSKRHFRGWERHRSNVDGYRAVVTTKYRGRQVAGNRWSGIFRAWVILRRGDSTIHCRSGLLRWTAVD